MLKSIRPVSGLNRGLNVTGVHVIKGRVVSFDRIKGYGFVAPETGGEDVFIHVNDLYSDKDLLTTGSIVEFRLEEGDRGPKASAVSVIRTASPHGSSVVPGPDHAVRPAPHSAAVENDDTVEVLTNDELMHELTEALLRVEPELTSRQIIDIRKRFAQIAHKHAWADR